MEFLDPKKRRAHTIRLFIGYFLIATALVLTTIILLYQAYGFGLKNGQVIQNGLIFVSSTPPAADIYVNGQKRSEQTNIRLLMPAGQYTFELKREGYRTWKRAINIAGGSVARFDYPLLFPTTLTPTAKKTYAAKPRIATQSPDHRWVVVQGAPEYDRFDVFDLSKPEKDPVIIDLPANITKLTAGNHSWKFLEWSSDNNHVLLQHVTDDRGKILSEYVLVDRENPEKSVNLSAVLGMNPAQLTLLDKKFDKYVLYVPEDKKLFTATLDAPKPVLKLDNVFGYKTYDDNKFLYIADDPATDNMAVKLLDGEKTYDIKHVTPAPNYLLDLAKYDDNWYVVAGSPTENRTYVFKNPVASLESQPAQPLVPVQVLKTPLPTYVSFSTNTRFIMVQNGQQFAVYDAENDKGYAYTADAPIDAPQQHAEWLDGYHLTYVSQGKTFVFDYDNTNHATLMAADSAFMPFFKADYKLLFGLSPQAAKTADGKDITQFQLNSLPLRTPSDL